MPRDQRWLAVIAMVAVPALAVAALALSPAKGPVDSVVSLGDGPKYQIDTTEGSFAITLFAEQAPHRVRQFEWLVEQGGYDCVAIGRWLPGHWAQVFYAKTPPPFPPAGLEARGVRHSPWLLSTRVEPAGAKPDTSFTILVDSDRSMDGLSAPFGAVIQGQNVVQSLATGNDGGWRPTITRIRKLASVEQFPLP